MKKDPKRMRCEMLIFAKNTEACHHFIQLFPATQASPVLYSRFKILLCPGRVLGVQPFSLYHQYVMFKKFKSCIVTLQLLFFLFLIPSLFYPERLSLNLLSWAVGSLLNTWVDGPAVIAGVEKERCSMLEKRWWVITLHSGLLSLL